jgi:hypothetical protein
MLKCGAKAPAALYNLKEAPLSMMATPTLSRQGQI